MVVALLARRVDGCSELFQCGPSRSRIEIGRQVTLSHMVLNREPSRGTPRQPPRSIDGDPINEFTTTAIVVEPNINKTNSDSPYPLAGSLLVSGFSVPGLGPPPTSSPTHRASLTWTELMPPEAPQHQGERFRMTCP